MLVTRTLTRKVEDFPHLWIDAGKCSCYSLGVSDMPKKMTTTQAYATDHAFIKAMAEEHDLNMPAALAAIVRGFRNASQTVQEQAFIPPNLKVPAESEVAA